MNGKGDARIVEREADTQAQYKSLPGRAGSGRRGEVPETNAV